MTTDDPTRWLDPASDATPRMRALFDAGRDELPAPEQLDSLAARLGPLFAPGGGDPGDGGGGGGGGGGAIAATTGKIGAGLGMSAKVGIAVVAIALGGVATWTWQRSRAVEPTVQAPTPAPRTEPRDVAPLPATPLPTGIDPAVVPDPPSPTSRPSPPSRAALAATPPAPAPAPAAPTEYQLVDQAQRTARMDPAGALTLADEHARRFPSGSLAQEREVIAIQALVRLGRREDATRRAERFHSVFPGSSHGRRIDVILAAPP